VTNPRDRAKPHDHLLVDDQHGHEQEQHPQQARAVVLARLRVRRDAARVVVADHHDQARAHDREQSECARAQPAAALLVLADRAEGAANVADVRGVEHEALARSRRRRRCRPRGRLAGNLDLLSARGVPPRPPVEALSRLDQLPAREGTPGAAAAAQLLRGSSES
jgi:hypothetical protein